jgi:hypothetical protein
MVTPPSFGPSQGKASCMVAVALCPKPGWKVSTSVGLNFTDTFTLFQSFSTQKKIF